jgi:hypothetical protein
MSQVNIIMIIIIIIIGLYQYPVLYTRYGPFVYVNKGQKWSMYHLHSTA